MQLRRAALADLDLLVRIDREDEGVTHGAHTWSEREIEVHRQLNQSFVIDGGARIAEVEGNAVGAILWRTRPRDAGYVIALRLADLDANPKV